MNKLSSLFIIATLCVVQSCTKKADLGDFDSQRWIDDIKGCSGQRIEMIDELIEIKPKLLGLYQKSIIKALGQPESQELYKRSQTYYIYNIDPAVSCDNAKKDGRFLEVRFTSLGIANEVNIK